MRLLITTPTGVVVDRDDVVSVRAEDPTGSFGILGGHADFVTALRSSIVGWRQRDAEVGYCAVRRGVLTVTAGRTVAVATREAIFDADVARLADTVRDWFHVAAEADRAARSETMRLQVMAVRQIMKYLRPEPPGPPGAGP